MEGGWELQAVSARAPTRARGSRFMGQRWLAMYEGLVDRVEEGSGLERDQTVASKGCLEGSGDICRVKPMRTGAEGRARAASTRVSASS